METAANVKQLSETFGISEAGIKTMLKQQNSPGYKAGKGKTSKWLCMPSKFEKLLLKTSEAYKG